MKEIEIFCPTFSPEAFKVAAKHLRVWYFDLNFWNIVPWKLILFVWNEWWMLTVVRNNYNVLLLHV